VKLCSKIVFYFVQPSILISVLTLLAEFIERQTYLLYEGSPDQSLLSYPQNIGYAYSTRRFFRRDISSGAESRSVTMSSSEEKVIHYNDWPNAQGVRSLLQPAGLLSLLHSSSTSSMRNGLLLN
jgi:hypothetical protein